MKSILKALVVTGVVLGVLGVASVAPAQAPPKMGPGVMELGVITIVGRVQKPIATVDVAKIQPKLTLAELRQPFLDRIEEAVVRDPF